MSSRVTPALVAVGAGVLLTVVLLVPYVAYQYRRRGEVGVGRALLAVGLLLYGLALVAYVILPVPPLVPDFCARYGKGVQLQPFHFVGAIQRRAAAGHSLFTNAVALGTAFNVLLFVPFGAFVRHLFGRGILAATALGAATSVLIELTQVTGDWFLFPCAYRVFDVDDLITNTTGTFLGTLLAPLLALVPDQDPHAPPDAPRPVTAARRLLGMACDWLTVSILGALLVLGYRAVLQYGLGRPPAQVEFGSAAEPLLGWLTPAALQLVLVLRTGATVGEHAVRLAPAAVRRTRPRAFLRWLTGIGGFALLQPPDTRVTDAVSGALVAVSLIAAVRSRGYRGLSYRLAGWQLRDAREPPSPGSGA